MSRSEVALPIDMLKADLIFKIRKRESMSTPRTAVPL
jgi:hypothetical protein